MTNSRTDWDRLGLFSQPEFISTGSVYSSDKPDFNPSASKGKQLMTSGYKQKSATQSGYFDSKFIRYLEGEPYNEPLQERKDAQRKANQKILGKAFIPAGTAKKPACCGSHYGTFSGRIEHFNTSTQQPRAKSEHRRNIYTSPAKHGTGYGYPNVTIGQDFKYASEPHSHAENNKKMDMESFKQRILAGPFTVTREAGYFTLNPHKPAERLPTLSSNLSDKKRPHHLVPFKPSGNPQKSGYATLNPFPARLERDPYMAPLRSISRPSRAMNKNGHKFLPTGNIKTLPQQSIIACNVNRFVHQKNYTQVKTILF